MKKQLNILNKELILLKRDEAIKGILLTGSVACGTAFETSDLDLILLSNKDQFITKIIDDILVETTFITFEKAKQKLQSNPIDVYHYLDSKILYDNGQLFQLLNEAHQIYDKYQTPKNEKKAICHWLKSTQIKIKSAIDTNNDLMSDYYMSTNVWKLLEGIWAVNNKPMPPSSTTFRSYNNLHIIPFLNWFESLFLTDKKQRNQAMLQIIDWLLPLLEQG